MEEWDINNPIIWTQAVPEEIIIEQLEAAWKKYQDFYKEQEDPREAVIHTLL